jgi:hypothetical protein
MLTASKIPIPANIAFAGGNGYRTDVENGGREIGSAISTY